jgi:hypothetical protein
MGEFLFLMAGFGPIALSLIARLAGYRLKQVYLISILVILTLFSALRFESGQDWDGYETFFTELDLQLGVTQYFYYGGATTSRFEIGFYFLNYIIKLLNGSYFHVLAICSVISGISIYTLYKPIKENTDFAIISYIGYAFLILGFAQARQSIGLAFFLFALASYLHKKRSFLGFLGLASIGVLFQYSVTIYIAMAIMGYFLTRFASFGRVVIFGLLGLAVLVKNLNTNLFEIFMLLAFNDTISEKLVIYNDTLTTGSVLNFIYSLVLLLNAGFVYINTKFQSEFRNRFLLNLTAFSLYVSFLIVFVLPGFYPLYSRIYILGSLLLPLSFFWITSSSTKQKKQTAVFSVFLAANYLALMISCFRLFFLLSDEYLPYNTWLF